MADGKKDEVTQAIIMFGICAALAKVGKDAPNERQLAATSIILMTATIRWLRMCGVKREDAADVFSQSWDAVAADVVQEAFDAIAPQKGGDA